MDSMIFHLCINNISLLYLASIYLQQQIEYKYM